MACSLPYLTEEKMNRILEDNGDVLLSVIRIDEYFLALLVKERAITSLEANDIRAIEQPSNKKPKLFDIIKSKVENFLSFCIILHRKLNRDDLVRDQFHLNIRNLERQKKEIEERREKEEAENTRLDELEKQEKTPHANESSTTDTCDVPTTNPPVTTYKKLTYSDVERLLTDHKSAFYSRFDPSNRVLADLRKFKVISPDTEDQLKASGITPDARKDTILETVKRRGVGPFLDFCLVLCQDDIQQYHLVKDVLGLNIDDIRRQKGLLQGD